MKGAPQTKSGSDGTPGDPGSTGGDYGGDGSDGGSGGAAVRATPEAQVPRAAATVRPDRASPMTGLAPPAARLAAARFTNWAPAVSMPAIPLAHLALTALRSATFSPPSCAKVQSLARSTSSGVWSADIFTLLIFRAACCPTAPCISSTDRTNRPSVSALPMALPSRARSAFGSRCFRLAPMLVLGRIPPSSRRHRGPRRWSATLLRQS